MTISTAYPDLLQNGTPADATQVMADFYAIQNDVNANAAANGANSDITSLTGLTTPLAIVFGGTGQTSASAALTAFGGLAITGNLSDLNNVVTARTNLGLSSMALQAANNVTITGGAISGVTISSASLDVYALLVSPNFTGTPTAPNAAFGTTTQQIATTAFLQGAVMPGNGNVGAYAAAWNQSNNFTAGNNYSGATLQAGGSSFPYSSGTWKCMGVTIIGGWGGTGQFYMMQRIA